MYGRIFYYWRVKSHLLFNDLFFLLINGSTFCFLTGNQFDLKIIYEHPLHHSCYQLICGQFGAVRNRDFLCAVGLDGTLAFFEQETFMTEKQLPLFLLPTPVVYVSNSDMFVASNADSYIEGYK